MIELIQVFIALILLLVGFGSLGRFVLNFLKISFSSLERVIVSLFTGFSLGISLMVGVAYLIGPSAYWLPGIFLLFALTNWREQLTDLQLISASLKRKMLSSLFVLVSTLTLTSTLILSGLSWQGRVYFQEIHDSVWHISLVKSLLLSFPPQHPSYPKIALEQYHYFYDLLIASIHTLSGASLSLLYFQVFSLFFCALLVGSAWILGKMINDKHGSLCLVFFTAFGGSFAYFIPLFISGNSWSESSFWVSQTFMMVVNPQLIYSFGLINAFLLIIAKFPKLTWSHHFLIILLLAPSIGFKSYSWVVLSVLYAVVLLWQLVVNKQRSSIIAGISYLIVSIPFLWLITGFKGSQFFYHPLWFLDSMVESPDRVNNIMWKFLEDHYRAKQNWPRVWQIKLQELGIFYIGNLGTRVLMLLTLVLLICRKLTRPQSYLMLVVFAGFLFSTIFPLIFLQEGIVWNSIQFWYFGLILANVFAAYALSWLLQKFPRTYRYILFFVVILLTVPTLFKSVKAKVENMPSVTRLEILALADLSEDDKILICPEETWLFKTTFISAFSPAQTYLSDATQFEILNIDKSPFTELDDIFRNSNLANFHKLIVDEDINVIICSQSSYNDFIEKSLDLPGKPYENWQMYHTQTQ